MKKVVLFFSFLLIQNFLISKNTTLFSPHDKPTNTLIQLIKETKKTLHVAMYCLTDKRIAQALIDAHSRGVTLTVLLDKYSTDGYGKADMLTEAGIDVFIFQTKRDIDLLNPDELEAFKSFDFDPIMHNKYAIFDGKKVWTGSFNWTNSANRRNWENVIIATDKTTVASYQDNFNLLSEQCEKYIPIHEKLIGNSLREKVESALQQAATDKELSQLLIAVLSHL